MNQHSRISISKRNGERVTAAVSCAKTEHCLPNRTTFRYHSTFEYCNRYSSGYQFRI